MAARFDDSEVLQATGATRTRPGSRTTFEGVCTDSRQLIPGCLFVALKGDRFDAHDFLTQAAEGGAAAVMVNSGKANDFSSETVAVYEVSDTVRALGRLARFHRDRFNIPLGAVTGSNGKTTTKEMVASILSTRGPVLKTQGNLNNEIGMPLTLLGLDATHVAAVVEMGMNHSGEIARLTEIARPDAGLITVVQAAHLAGLGSIEGIAKAKAELFYGLPYSSTAVVNVDEPLIVSHSSQVSAKTMTFGTSAHAQVRLLSSGEQGRSGLLLKVGYEGQSYSVSLQLLGQHNALNATGAFALGLSLGYSPDECVRGLQATRAYARRLQLLEAPDHVTVVDDCYNANPASMRAALQTVKQLAAKGRAVAVLGDMLELGAEEEGEHTQMGIAAASGVALLALFGPLMKHAYAEAVKRLGEKVRHFDEVGALLDWLQPALRPDDVVLVKGSRGMKLERVVEGITKHSALGGH